MHSSYESDAHETLRTAQKRIRDEFQAKHPHYTPPQHASVHVWSKWVDANLDLHGQDGFRERGLDKLVNIRSIGTALSSSARRIVSDW